MRLRLRLGVVLCGLLAPACGQDVHLPVALLWSPGAGELDVFPDDAFTRDDPSARTGIRLSFDPDRFAQLRNLPASFKDIFRTLSTLDGFGLQAGVILRFDGKLDPAALPEQVAAADRSAPIVLLVERAGSLEPWPYLATLIDDSASVILEPLRPLPPRAHAMVAVTSRLLGADGLPVRASHDMGFALRGFSVDAATARVAQRIGAAAQTLVDMGVVARIEDLAGVVVFSTQSVHEDSLAIAADVAQRQIRPAPGTVCTQEPQWVRCEGHFTAVDYRGLTHVMPDLLGPPDISVTYVLPFTVWLPLQRPGPYGGSALPTLMYGHGLGGDRTQAARLAEFAAPRGVATIAIDAVSHGQHPTATATDTLGRVLSFFAISVSDGTFAPLEMREHFRQSSYDKLQLARMVELGLDLDGDGRPDLDAQRFSYLGVSLGGIMGPEPLALLPALRTGILVVPGARVGTIIRDSQTFQPLITLMKPPGTTDGDVARFFPILQTLIDRGDPGVWAPHLLDTPAERPAGFPPAWPHILMGMVIDDDTVPNSSNRALARALGVPVVPPVRQPVELVGMTGAAPVRGNWPDGRTAGLLQFDRVLADDGHTIQPATHSNIGASSVGADAWLKFLDGELKTGTPVIVDPYVDLGLPP